MENKTLKIALITMVLVFALMLGAMSKAEQGRQHAYALDREIRWELAHNPMR